jgi:integrase
MNLNRRFKQAIKVLGPDCCSSIHDGRHSFASIAPVAGRTLPEVRDALGHPDGCQRGSP